MGIDDPLLDRAATSSNMAILPSSSSGTGSSAVHIPEIVLSLGWDLPSGSSGIVHSSNALSAYPGPLGRVRSANVSQRCYYAYHLHVRPGEQPLLLHRGNLLQQYIVDAWASTEQSALNWIRHN